MRINFRFKFGLYTLFFMLSHTQKLEGISSLVNKTENMHIPMFDLENTSLDEAKNTLNYIQQKYHLSTIYIMSDKENSYRAICYLQVDFKTYLRMLLEVQYLDYNFFYWTVQRSKATMRISDKKGREKLRIVDVLETYYQPIPKQLEQVIYDTGNDKQGLFLQWGKKHEN